MNLAPRSMSVLLCMVLVAAAALAHAQAGKDTRELVAVLDLDSVGATKPQIAGLSEQLRAELLGTGKYRLVDRAQMNKVLEEQAFQQTGCTSQECAVQVGKILGVRKLVVGRVTKIEETLWQVSAMLVDVESAETLQAVTVNQDGNYRTLLTTGISSLTAKLTGKGGAVPAPVVSSPSPARTAPPASAIAPATSPSSVDAATSGKDRTSGEKVIGGAAAGEVAGSLLGRNTRNSVVGAAASSAQAAVQGPAPSSGFRDPTTNMEFVYVAGGTYQQGCVPGDNQCSSLEKPPRAVTLRPFLLGKFEVTQQEWVRIMGMRLFQPGTKDTLGDMFPVESVRWADVQEFIKQLSARSGVRYRLPTEAEWEYACRNGGRPQRFPWGDAAPAKGSAPMANIADETWNRIYAKGQGPNYAKGHEDGYAYSAPVGSFPPNGLGLHEMSGNVAELVEDVYDDKGYEPGPAENPVRKTGSGGERVLRGGYWLMPPEYSRCTSRSRVSESIWGTGVGFRLARDP